MAEEEEYEEEEIMLHVEFDGMLDADLLKRSNPLIKFIGLDTEQPTAQIEGQVFVGSYKDTTGTALFFQETEPDIKDAVFSRKYDKQLKFVCKTHKSLQMKRVFLGSKAEVVKENASSAKDDGKDNSESVP